MNDENYLFLMNGFSPSWAEDVPVERKNQTDTSYKDLDTLKSELNEIKEHLQDIQAREWQIAKLIEFHQMNFAKE